MSMPSILSSAIAVTVYLKYPLIFLATPIGGPFLIIAAGFLLHEGHLSLVPLFLALTLGELSLDVLWYALGFRYLDNVIRRFGKYFSFTPEVFEKVKAVFARYRAATLFFNKIFMGLGMGIAVLLTAGATKMRFSTYMFWNAIGEVIWVSVMLYIGYSYASFLSHIEAGLRVVSALGIAIFALIAVIGVSRYLRSKLL